VPIEQISPAGPGDRKFLPEEFRRDLQAWLEETLPSIWGGPKPPVRPTEDADMAMRLRFDQALFAAGWAALSWPQEYGGQGASVEVERILAEECAQAGAPERYNRVGLGIVAPTLIHHGTTAQKERYLRPLLAAEEIWCQGFSEPNAGSDLASLTTRASMSDGGWRIAGQKVWTTLSSIADFCLVLARTGGPNSRHRGISAFIVPMHQGGVTVRPIRQINDSTEFSEVYFDDAETAPDPVVGEINCGWGVAMSVLGYERSTNLLNRQTRLAAVVGALREAVQRRPESVPVTLLDALVDIWIRSEALRYAVREHIAEIAAGRPPGIGNNATKVYWSETYQALGDLGLQIRGLRPDDRAPLLDAEPDWLLYYLGSRAASIYAGTDEIQRNIIAERGLGLPRYLS
jgi:alkylation response protein AidB-like acyl-CoA dehydrogenase